MAQPPGSAATDLLGLSVQLKNAAVRAGRLDVAAKADEAIALLADADDPIVDRGDPEPGRDDKANTVLKFFDVIAGAGAADRNEQAGGGQVAKVTLGLLQGKVLRPLVSRAADPVDDGDVMR